MSTKTLNISGTHVAMGASIHRFFFGPIAVLVYGTVLIAATIGFWFSGGSYEFIVALAILTYPIFIFHLFLEQIFMEEKKPRWEDCDSGLLSFAIVRQFKYPRKVSMKDLLDAVINTQAGSFIVREMGIEPEKYLISVNQILEKSPDIDPTEVLSDAKKVMEESGRHNIDAGSILYSLCKKNESFRDLLHEMDLSIEDLQEILLWERYYAHFAQENHFFSQRKLLKIFGGVGRSWVMGYTNELDRLTDDISEHILWRGLRYVRIHKEEQKQALRILEKSDLHDLLIIGDVGVGKKTLVENIAFAIRKYEREKFRAYTRILIVKTAELLSGVSNPDTFLLHSLKKAQESGSFILVIEDLALMISSGGEKVQAILMKFINEKNVQLIGIMNTQEYHQLVKGNPALDHFFEKLMVDDASQEETMSVLMEQTFNLEKKISVRVTYKALRSVLQLSERYLPNLSYPGKAVSVLEDAMSLAKSAGDKFVKEKHIREIVSHKGHIDVSELTQNDKEKVLQLGEILHKRIVGQEAAVEALVSTLKRAVLELHSENKPLGTFLFLGPTGVGKTHTAKILAEEYFGSIDNMIRLDMNDFSTENSVTGIVGSQQGSTYLARRVQDQPFALILLDEIEKAHPKVVNLFLQILDEGHLVDFNGVKTDFRNTIIISTSNAGALFVREFLKENEGIDHATFEKRLTDHIMKQGIFSPEFLNRFDDIVFYHALTKEEATRVAILMLDDIVKEMKDKKGIDLKVEEEVVRSIAEKGYSIEFGAREMRRTIVDTIENRLADYMLKNDVKRGEEVVIHKENADS
ncbi:AAA family ATPase [Patescibacteria group bacterium]|nr:AAA family ATPase [Patescibacteria group bacterium]